MKHLLIAFLFVFGLTTNAQILDPVKWDHTVNKLSDTEYELVFKADIDEGWHIYSQNLSRDDGPLATEVTFSDAEGNVELIGKTSEPPSKPVFDKAFQMEIKYFGGTVELKQKIKVLKEGLKTIKGEVFFMVCDDEKCLPPDTKEFVFDLTNTGNNKANELVEPVKWSITTEKLSDTKYKLIYKAAIQDKWHLYSQNLPEERLKKVNL